MIKVAVGIHIKDDEVLVVSRKGGGYGFPGGKVDEGERIVDGLIREVKEETGLDVTDYALLGTESFDNYRVFYYYIDIADYDIYTIEGNECFFMDFKQFRIDSFHPKNTDFLDYAIERQLKEVKR